MTGGLHCVILKCCPVGDSIQFLTGCNSKDSQAQPDAMRSVGKNHFLPQLRFKIQTLGYVVGLSSRTEWREECYVALENVSFHTENSRIKSIVQLCSCGTQIFLKLSFHWFCTSLRGSISSLFAQIIYEFCAYARKIWGKEHIVCEYFETLCGNILYRLTEHLTCIDNRLNFHLITFIPCS